MCFVRHYCYVICTRITLVITTLFNQIYHVYWPHSHQTTQNISHTQHIVLIGYNVYIWCIRTFNIFTTVYLCIQNNHTQLSRENIHTTHSFVNTWNDWKNDTRYVHHFYQFTQRMSALRELCNTSIVIIPYT